jgi:Ca2+:H+ antiporter
MSIDRKSAMDFGLPIGALLVAVFASIVRPAAHAAVPMRVLLAAGAIGLLFATVFVVLRHAEAVAHRLGEPYGTLVLTLSVTIIEASLIISMMLHGANNPTLARESVFSTVMIVCAGVVGLCLTLGGWRHGHQELKRQGTSAFLAMLIAMTGFTLVLPNYTLASDPGTFSTFQLGFVSLLGLLLYLSFVAGQMNSYRSDFVEELDSELVVHSHGPQRNVIVSALLLFVGLAGIVLLAERTAGGIEDSLTDLGVKQIDAVIGAFVATLVLLPESAAAVKAAMQNELQRSLNIALGSACATIGLTIPVVAAAGLFTGRSLTLGLAPGDTVLLIIALGTSVVSFSTGRTTVLTGLVHLVIFFAYLLLIAVP